METPETPEENAPAIAKGRRLYSLDDLRAMAPEERRALLPNAPKVIGEILARVAAEAMPHDTDGPDAA